MSTEHLPEAVWRTVPGRNAALPSRCTCCCPRQQHALWEHSASWPAALTA